MKKLFALFLFLSLAASALAQTNPVDELVRSFMSTTHTPGVSVAVMRNGKVESVSSYGIANSEYQITVSPETSFQMASGSKIFTSALLFRLLEQKKIALDDPLAKYVADAPPAWSAITIRDLAAHISGLAAPDVDSNITSSEAIVKLAVKVAPEAKPGERANYGDFDYPILQYILEKVCRQDLSAQIMQEEIFQPLGFHCTMYDDAEQHGPQRMSKIVPNRAEYYRWMKTDTDTFNQKREFLAYEAGLRRRRRVRLRLLATSPRSLPQSIPGKLFSRESLNSARTPPRLADGTHSSFGLGWVVGHYRGHAWMGHSGGPAFSDMMYFPEDHLAIVVLTNQQKLYPQLASLIADLLLPNPAGLGKRQFARRRSRAHRESPSTSRGHGNGDINQPNAAHSHATRRLSRRPERFRPRMAGPAPTNQPHDPGKR